MNKQPITITGTITAWLVSSRDTLDGLVKLAENDPQDAISDLGYSNGDMDKGSYPWTKVGTAEVTVTLFPRDEVVAEQLKTLNAELQKERADSQMRQNEILNRISKLQALEFADTAEA